MLKDRYDSKWNRIIVVGSEGIPDKVFELDRVGQLKNKFPKQKYRKNLNKDRKIPASQSYPFLVDEGKNENKAVVSKFINAILRYNQMDMSVMKLFQEQQKNYLPNLQNSQLQENKQYNSTFGQEFFNDFSNDNQILFDDNFDELLNSSDNQNDFDFNYLSSP